MPAESEKQRRFMGSELGRLREGKKTRTGMSEEQLEDFAEKPVRKDFFEHMEKTYGFKIEKGGPGSGRKPGVWPGAKNPPSFSARSTPKSEQAKDATVRKPGHKVARSFDEPHKRGEGVYYPPKLFRGLPSIKDVASGKVKDNRSWKPLNKD